jgi:hypothetical protein
MNQAWKKMIRRENCWHRAASVLFCVVLVCTLLIDGVPQARAVESNPETSSTARQLQLEGARLQLQGNLEEAVKKYQESTALQPNPRLDALIKQLEPKIGKKEVESTPAATAAEIRKSSAAPQTPAQLPMEQPAAVQPSPTSVAPATTTPVTEAGSVPAPSSAAGIGQVVETAEPPQRTPSTPQEELVYTFVDWFVNLFPASRPDMEFSLQTNRHYTIDQVDGEYEVRLEPFTLVIDTSDTLELGPVLVRCKPQGDNRLAVRLQFADKAPIKNRGKLEAELTVGSQQLSGVWNRSLMNFDKLDLQLADLVIEDVRKEGRLSLAGLSVEGGHSEQQGGAWLEKYRGALKRLAFVDKEIDFGIEAIEGQFAATGTNAPRFLELRARLQKGFNRIDKLELAEIKPLMTDLDEYLQLLSGYTSSAALQNFKVTAKEGSVSLASIALSGRLQKEAATGKFVYDTQGQCNDFSFIENKTDKKPQPLAFSLRQIGLRGDGRVQAPPPHLFAEMFTVIEGYQQVKKEEADAYAARHGYAFAQKIIALIESYSGELTMKELKVVNAQPTPITLEQATLAAGFDVGDGQGGKIHSMVDFFGFQGMNLESKTVPEAGRVRLEVSRIPSLLSLIKDPSPLASGNVQALQGQVMMNGMDALMQSGLTLSLKDSFVVFPAAKITLALLSQVDPQAKYLSTGTLNLAVENPEELLRIVRTYSADPEMEKMLATITALADRRQENGQTVDVIEANVDASGKVFINTKDVTSMFFPPTPAPTQGAGPTPAK